VLGDKAGDAREKPDAVGTGKLEEGRGHGGKAELASDGGFGKSTGLSRPHPHPLHPPQGSIGVDFVF